MNDEVTKLPLFTRIFYRMMRFITKFSIPILIIITLTTVYFTFQLKNLRIDANVFSFTSGVEQNPYVETPSKKPDGEPLVFITPEKNVTNELHYGYIERAEEEKLKAIIPAQTGKKSGSYPDGYVVLFTSDLLYTRMYYQFRSICRLYKNVSDVDIKRQYYNKIMNLLNLIYDQRKKVCKGMFYGSFKDKLFCRLIFNKITRKHFFDRVVL